MDMFFTIIMWIVGLSAGLILLMAIGFSLGGAAQTGNSELGIASLVSTGLFFYLVWKGISSLFFSESIDVIDTNVPARVVEVAVIDTQTPSVQVANISAPSAGHENRLKTTKVEPAVQKTETKQVVMSQNNLILWAFYILAFLGYFYWLLSPSKIKGKGRDVIKQKFIASMTLKEDESGLKPWNPNWKPEKDKK